MGPEQLAQICHCCACGGTIDRVNLVALGKKATWEYPSAGNVLAGEEGRAVAVCCDRCVEQGAMIISEALELRDGQPVYHPVGELEDMLDPEDEEPNEEITVLLFEPGKPPRFVRTRDGAEDFRRLLGAGSLDATLLNGVRRYFLWCDDEGVEKGLGLNRRLIAGIYAGFILRGPFFVTRIIGDRDRSVCDDDLPYIRQFVEF